MVNNKCFVPGCNSGYSNQPKCSLFHPPKSWTLAIPRKDRKLSSTDVVCEKHFSSKDIQKFYDTKLPDGSFHKIEGERPRLKNDAVPSIFPNLPEYLSHLKKRRKPPLQHEQINKKASSETTKRCGVNVADINNTDLEDVVESISFFETILENLNSKSLTILPFKEWAGCYVPYLNKIVFAEWKEDLTVKKKIVLASDLSFQVS